VAFRHAVSWIRATEWQLNGGLAYRVCQLVNTEFDLATGNQVIAKNSFWKRSCQKTIAMSSGSLASVINAQATVNAGAIFHIHDVTKVYRMGEVDVHALRGVDFDLHQGEFVVVLGPSGSGKSTLLNILGGLDTPTSGEVLYRDHNLTSATDAMLTRYRREHVGFVFQFYNLIPSLTALENVALVTEIAENPMDPAEALRMVGLGERLNHFPAQLSGGEQQRVAIARAVAKTSLQVSLRKSPGGAICSLRLRSR
jgi:putative ABC transport system ATP-binding protein